MRYRVTVKGLLGEASGTMLDAAAVEHVGGDTALTYEVRDQSDLWGRLMRIDDLGLLIIAIESRETTGLPRSTLG